MYNKFTYVFAFAWLMAFAGINDSFAQAQSLEDKSVLSDEGTLSDPMRRHLIGMRYRYQYINRDYVGGDDFYSARRFHLGFAYEYRLSKNLSFLSNVGYNQVERWSASDGATTDRGIELSAGLRYYLLRKGRFSLYGDFMVNQEFLWGTANYTTTSASVGIGASFDITDRIRLSSTVNLQYNGRYGLTGVPDGVLQIKF